MVLAYCLARVLANTHKANTLFNKCAVDKWNHNKKIPLCAESQEKKTIIQYLALLNTAVFMLPLKAKTVNIGIQSKYAFCYDGVYFLGFFIVMLSIPISIIWYRVRMRGISYSIPRCWCSSEAGHHADHRSWPIRPIKPVIWTRPSVSTGPRWFAMAKYCVVHRHIKSQ